MKKKEILEQLFKDVNFLDLNVTLTSGHMSMEGKRAIETILLLIKEEEQILSKTA